MIAATHVNPDIAAAITKVMINMGKRAFKHGAAPTEWWTVEMYKGWAAEAKRTFDAINAVDTDAALALAEAFPKVEFSEEAFAGAEFEPYNRQGVDYIEPSL